MPEGIAIEEIIPPPLQCDLSEAWTIAIVSLASFVPLTLFTDWLKKKLTDKATTKITRNRKEIYFDEGQIIIEKHLKETITIISGGSAFLYRLSKKFICVIYLQV